MEQKLKVPVGTKETLRNKAETVFENVKEKVGQKAEGIIHKAKESELAEKAKEKITDLKGDAKGLFNKVTDKFSGKKQV